MAATRLVALEEGAATRSASLDELVRRSPIRWRILAIAVLNSAVALILLALIWNGARVLGDAWADLRRVRASERFLTTLNGDAERLQSLVHRYIARNDPDVLARTIELGETVISRLRVQARLDPLIAEPTRPMTEIMEQLISGFDELRAVRESLVRSYELKVLAPSRDMARLYAALIARTAETSSLIWPALAKSREAYNALVLAASAYYLSASPGAAEEAKLQARAIRQSAAEMLGSAGEDAQREPLRQLSAHADAIETGLAELAAGFAKQGALLEQAIDRNTAEMSAAVSAVTSQIHDLETSAQARFDRTLQDVAVKLGLLALAFVVLVVLMGLAIARSISEPLGELRSAMQAISGGDLGRRVTGLEAKDEIGEMARAVEVFREDAIAKRRADEELLAAKEHAEAALIELRETQTNLIEAEKFAALGGLVAGVAHEVNNPVGISLTVASSLALRCDDFAKELASGQLRRSRLEDFTSATRTAANQLVANLQRAGELVQAFKQVAVDRSQGERRSFELKEAVEQILASLRPTLKKSGARLTVEVPEGIVMESYPGPLGQILTNLFLNSLFHAFGDRNGGTISVIGRRRGSDQVEILFRDDGTGMTEEVQRRAFDPFFTTRRGAGGTGLGLHIVYNLVTARLGGRIVLSSAPGLGSTFLIVLPLAAPGTQAGGEPQHGEADHVAG